MGIKEMRELAPGRRAEGQPASPLHTPLAVLGGIIGVLAAFAARYGGWGWPSALVTFAAVAGVVGSLLPDTIVGPRRLARALYRSVLIGAGVAGFALAAVPWGPTWPALLAGGGAGVGAGIGLQILLFRDLVMEDWGTGRANGRRVAESGATGWHPGGRDAAIVAAGLLAVLGLAVLGAGAAAYALTGLATLCLLLVSGIVDVRRRRDGLA